MHKEFVAKRTKGFGEAFKEKILNDEYANPEFPEKIEGYEYLSKLSQILQKSYGSKGGL